MNRRTFLSLPLLGFCSTMTEPVYGSSLIAQIKWAKEDVAKVFSVPMGTLSTKVCRYKLSDPRCRVRARMRGYRREG
jgi:hypothetical protein